MKKIILILLLSVSMTSFSQTTVDPSVGAMDFADGSNVSLNATSLPITSTVFLKVPIFNANELNAMPSGTATVSINFGNKLTLAPDFVLSTSPMSEYFNWSVSGSTITGTLIAPLPNDYFAGMARFKFVANTAGNSSVLSQVGTQGSVVDENLNNNESQIQYSVTSAPLPVELLQFSGKKESENKNLLSWITSNEKDFSHFSIEKSGNALSFEAIGRVNGNMGKSTSFLKNYNFTDDKAINPINYYRLKMVDLDGSFKYSKIINLENEIPNSVVGEFYPNPVVSEKSFIDIISKEAGEWEVVHVDEVGRMIKADKVRFIKGVNKYAVDGNKLSVGLNIFKFSKNETIESRKIIKQ